MSVALGTSEQYELGGLLSKIHKIHRKYGAGKIEQKVAKKLPAPLRKIEEKRFALEDKVANNKTLNKIAAVVAVAVAAYFTGGAALSLLKTYGPVLAKSLASTAVSGALKEKQAEQIEEAQEKAAKAEEEALQKQIAALEQEQAHAHEMQEKGLLPVQQPDGSVAWLPDPRSPYAAQSQELVPVATASGQTALLPADEVATATEGFVAKYRTPLLIGGIGLVALAVLAMRKKRSR